MLTYYFIFINYFAKELPYLNTNIGQLINAEKFIKEITKKHKEIDPLAKNKITKSNRMNDVTLTAPAQVKPFSAYFAYISRF